MSQPSSPQPLFEIAFAFRQAKVLLSAVELGLFTVLAEGPLDQETLSRRLALHGRGSRDLFDALVAMRLLDRDDAGRYSNTSLTATYLDARAPDYIGGRLDYLNASAYGCWGRLTSALRQGTPQSGPFAAGGFSSYYAEPSSLQTFVGGMNAGSIAPARALARAFDWSGYRTFIDIGTAQGGVPVEIARAHPHLTGGGFDLPSLEPMFTRYVAAQGLSQRLSFHAGDFTRVALPEADVLLMGRILHDWDRTTAQRLLRNARSALPEGGVLIVWEAMIDDARRDHAEGLLSSLNMLLNTDAGRELTRSECASAMAQAGFGDIEVLPLDATYTAITGRRGARVRTTLRD